LVEPFLILWVLLSTAAAGPRRAPPPKPQSIRWTAGRRRDLLVVKLVEDAGLSFDAGLLSGPGDLTELAAQLAGAERLFRRPAAVIAADAKRVDPTGELADLNLYLRLKRGDAVAVGNRLLRDPRVEIAYLALLPVAPPQDIPPETPDFVELQGYLGPAPDGFGIDIAAAWPGGTGANVAVADLEYSFDRNHEDLGSAIDALRPGWDSGTYMSHGNGVIGMLVGGDNGYGVRGMVPDAELVVASPYVFFNDYNVPAAIDDAAALLDAGDVFLLEQQGLLEGIFAPVEADPAVFDVIALTVAKGVVVVEPAGNGGLDLDGPAVDGWFDRSVRDSGAIIVGGGVSPTGPFEVRSWFPGGGSFGERVDVQGWYDSVVTATTDEYGPDWADLFLPDGDSRQAYTSLFGGTSGAAPMVAAVAAIANSVAWELWGEPWDPMELRAALVSTGTPQAEGDEFHIGPQPDLRRLLRTWAVR
jgi:serine protease